MKKTAKGYEHLKGKELTLKMAQNRKWKETGTNETIGFVADIDPKIGITILAVDNQGELRCVNKNRLTPAGYIKHFEHTVKCIEDGLYDESADPQYQELTGGIGFFSGCAFSSE